MTVKCRLVVAGRWAVEDRHQRYACPDTLTASPPSPSFPRSPLDLSVVVPRYTGGITIQWPPVTGCSVNRSVSVGSLQSYTNDTANRKVSTIAIWSFFYLETELYANQHCGKSQYVFIEYVLCVWWSD